MVKKRFILMLSLSVGLLMGVFGAQGLAEEPQNKDIILATTTSTVDSGLLDVLLPVFEKQTGYRVKTISVGTGQALAMGEKGEADVLLTHAPDSEKKLVDAGVVTNYQLVMHNDLRPLRRKRRFLFHGEMIPVRIRKSSPYGKRPK
jgi:tungstate transport system substrate-binding protein